MNFDRLLKNELKTILTGLLGMAVGSLLIYVFYLIFKSFFSITYFIIAYVIGSSIYNVSIRNKRNGIYAVLFTLLSIAFGNGLIIVMIASSMSGLPPFGILQFIEMSLLSIFNFDIIGYMFLGVSAYLAYHYAT